ncbi:MAG: VCBS repeat-containing protein, partial [Candidatus Hinthialibacter sp.]
MMNSLQKMMIVSLILAAAGSAQYACGEDPSTDRDRHRLLQNNPGLIVDLGVGLWAIPFPVDWDGDGDNDLLVSTADVPYNGLYYFENDGTGIFKAGERIGTGKRNVTPSYVEGEMYVFEPGKVYRDF